MGTWGTYVVSVDTPAVSEVVENVAYPGGWHRVLVSELLTATPDQIAATVGAAPAVFATVADSDYCAVAGVADGAVRWSWSFGIPPWDPSLFDDVVEDEDEGEDADPESMTRQARDASVPIGEWAARAGLTPPDPAVVTETLDQGYGFAEEGFFALLEVLGIAPKVADLSLDTATLATPPTKRRIRISSNPPHRWLSLMFNTTADLYEHLSAVASWLDQARRTVVLPLMATYEPAKLRTSIGNDESIHGAPDGLLVRSSGWSTKERMVFGAGDDAGWTRTLGRLSKGQLREIKLHATAFSPSGRAFGGPGDLNVEAVLRDQFTQTAVAPLPAEHPGQLKVFTPIGLLDRVPSFDAPKILSRLGQLAVDTIPGGHVFLELERPLHPHREIVPVSPLGWTSPPGAVEFRPDSVEFYDSPGRDR
jgi:hypothetical protein